jgi:hypothetical protein
MTDLQRMTPIVATIVLILAACGGGGGGTTTAAPTDAAATSGPTQAPATDAPATDAPAVTPAPAGGGGGAAGVCELVTPEELAGTFGVPSVKATVFPGPPDNCIVESDAGAPLAAWSLTTAQGGALFDAFTSDPSSIEVSGIGDKAALVDNTGLLVLKGGALLVISISSGADMSEDEVIEASKQIGAIAAGRM